MGMVRRLQSLKQKFDQRSSEAIHFLMCYFDKVFFYFVQQMDKICLRQNVYILFIEVK